MKVLLVKDVYKLGRAGDVKKVADGYGRNYLIPQGLAILATPGALKQVEQIREHADARRAVLNKEMSGIADLLTGLTLTFPVKAGETGKLYGSVTPQMIVDAVKRELELDVDRRQVDHEPIRLLGKHQVPIRLTMDLVPEITVIVYREGESPESVEEEAEAQAEAEEQVESSTETDIMVEAEPLDEAISYEEEVEPEPAAETQTAEE
jgi:large subunit ribosomal protein L9